LEVTMQQWMLRIGALVAVLAMCTPASAEDACAQEAAATASVGRDASLTPPTEDAAKEHLEAGNRAFRVQQYDKAIDEYTAAGLATSAPLVLYNLGQALRASKQYEKAIRQYQLFLSRGAPGKELRAFVECVVATMKGELEAAASTAPPTGPAPDDTATKPAPDRDASEPDPADLPPPPPSRWTGRRKIALVTAGAGVLAIGAGIAFGMRSNGFEDDAADVCPNATCASAADADRANDLVDKAKSNATYANIGFGVGAVAVAGAVVLWITGSPASAPTESETATVSPQLTRDGGGVLVRVPF
jgi:tetratricopeptide (TPR) repeat protein